MAVSTLPLQLVPAVAQQSQRIGYVPNGLAYWHGANDTLKSGPETGRVAFKGAFSC
jgi:hypothetical protein